MPLFRPSKPKGHAALLADVSIAAGAQTIPLDSEVWSEGDVGWVGGPGFTVGRAGLYLVVGSIARAAVGATSSLQVRIHVNGAAPTSSTNVVTPATTGTVTAQCVEMLPLLVGDTVTLRGLLSGSAAATARAAGTKLVIARIGPERWT